MESLFTPAPNHKQNSKNIIQVHIQTSTMPMQQGTQGLHILLYSIQTRSPPIPQPITAESLPRRCSSIVWMVTDDPALVVVHGKIVL